ncbi:hypothetical protein [Cryptosporangium phraense]|uniref:Uncharacterized protein n=1 Tax=Cryptosporangium phraense TaxID=2593070 RepID=A0A545ALE4_9ACTN|nr:hypothetical protein [Cryptosporangium phraense]TQS42136.1 hypothetical protein FL583_26485 [Cryptosporangium phraense]
MKPTPLDEYPIHQAPLPIARAATSDRNFYDRSYFNAHDRTGETFLITGLGTYPNLGVIDAYALVRRGDTQYSVKFSDALETRGLEQAVGPYRVEVLDALQRVRVICDAADLGVGFDLAWEGSFPAVMEQPHLMLNGPAVTLDASRFAQVGTWSGTLNLDGTDIAVDPDTWLGTRDRSWGIRPSGEAPPPGRPGDPDQQGFWWLYVPLRFDDFALIVIVQESPDGYRTLNDASRVFPDGRVEQLGWPRVEISYVSGTRIPTTARLHCTTPDGKPLLVEVESLVGVPLHVGAGYGGDPDWSHGTWHGRDWSRSDRYDMTDPAVAGRIPWGVVDHAARATCDGAVGWGLFEHASVGRHDPSGFADWSAVSP